MNQSSYTADTLVVCNAGIRTHQRLNADSRMTYRIIILLLVCPVLLWESLSKQPLKTGSLSYLLKLPGMVVLRIHLSTSNFYHLPISNQASVHDGLPLVLHPTRKASRSDTPCYVPRMRETIKLLEDCRSFVEIL